MTTKTISEREPRALGEKALMVRTEFVRLTGIAATTALLSPLRRLHIDQPPTTPATGAT